MANTKSMISEISLRNPDVNLTNCLSEIKNYDGIQKCNSLHVGGMLNNVYEKNIEVPEGYTFITSYNGELYAWKYDDPINKIGVRVYNVTDSDNPVEVLDLSCPDSAINNLGYMTVKKTETGLDYNGDWTIGQIEHKRIGISWIYNPFLEGNRYGSTNFFNSDCAYNYSIVDGKMYFSSLRLLSTGSGKKIDLVELLYNATTYSATSLACYVFDENGYTQISTLENMFVVVGSAVIYFKGLFDTIRDTETCKQLVIDTDRFYFETEPNDTTETYAERRIYYLKDDSPRIINSNYLSYFERFSSSEVAGSDIWNAHLLINECFPIENGTDDIVQKLGLNLYIYNNTTVALAVNDKIYSYNINRIIFKDSSTGKVYCEDNNGKIIILELETAQEPTFSIADDCIISDSICSVYNIFDMSKKTVECFAYAPPVYFLGIEAIINDIVYITWIAGSQEQWNALNLKFPSLNFPPVTSRLQKDRIYNRNNVYLPRRPHSSRAYPINYYYGENKCVYVSSRENVNYISPLLINMSYPIQSDGNVIYPVPLDNVINETPFNEMIVKTDEGNFIAAHSQNKNPVFAYFLYSLSELDSMFLMQTGLYGQNDNYIYGASIKDNVTYIGDVVANTLDLQFLGAFPTMALFWSKLDKSIYVFTGDNNLRKLKEAYKVETIGAIYCDPSRLTLLISTNIGLLILYQDQVILLDEFELITDNNKIYYDYNCYIVNDRVISFSSFEGAKCKPIHLQTEFFGTGNCIKSVNDCVYIRLGKNSLKEGYIKIKAITLTDTTRESTEQMFTFNDTMFDSVSEQVYIQYQPQLQAGAGFSLDIESTHPIAYVGISHAPEAIQQAVKYKPNVMDSPASIPSPNNFSFE